MPTVYKSGDCLYEIYKKCILGDKGVMYDPICCLTCVLAKALKVITNDK